MFPPENLNLASPRAHTLNHPIGLIRLPTGLPDLTHYYIGVEATICPGWELKITGFVDVRLDTY
jgi:hypothetical protein